MMFSANTAMRCTAPPENMLNMSSTPCFWPRKDCLEGAGIDARQRDVGAEPVDDQRAEREPDALLELFGLAEGGPIDVGGKLFGCRCHRSRAPSVPRRGSRAPERPAWLRSAAAGYRRNSNGGLCGAPFKSYGPAATKRHPFGRRLRQLGGDRLGRQRLDAAAGLFDRLDRALRRAVDLERWPWP